MSNARRWEVTGDVSDRGGPLVYTDRIANLDVMVSRVLGRGVFVYEIDYLADGRAIAYLGNTLPTDTSPAPDQPEVSFLNYVPIGAAVAVPADDGRLAVHLPDRDALGDAARARADHENDHRGSIIPSLLNLLKDRREMHYEKAGDYGFHDIDSLDDLDLNRMGMFHLGREVGMQKMASLAHRRLSGRLDAPYDGIRRWQSPEYSVIRKRRTVPVTDWPGPIATEDDDS